MDLSTKNAITSSVGGFSGGLISGLFGMIGQNRMLRAQQQENLLNFQRNKELAKLQNQLNLDQWNRENLYNLPKNQIQRLKEAGLSPSLIYKNGASGLQSASSPDLTGGTPSSPVDQTLGGTRKTFGDISQQAMNMALQSRELQLLQSQIKKTDSEREGIDIENTYLPQLKQSEIDERVANMGLRNAEKQRTLGLISNDKLVGQQTKQNIELIKSQMTNIDVNSYSQLVNLTFKQQEIEIARYIAESNKALNDSNIKINEQHYKKMVELLPYEIEQANLDNQKTYSDIMINLATHAGILSENEVKAYNAVLAGQQKEYILEHTGYSNYLMVIDAADKTSRVIESVSRTLKNISSLFKRSKKDDDSSTDDKANAVNAVQLAATLAK